MSHTVVRAYPIPGGTLHVRTTAERLPLDDLLGFAARANPRRPFLFVSKVLGRHVPCRPSRMRKTYRLLAADIAGIPGPVWVIGMAETATGLAAGLADTLVRMHARADVSFHHTTRLPLDREPLAAFRETHSHAPSHLLHAPQMTLADRFSRTRSLVLVDDEISTGRTLTELAAAALAYMPCIEHVAIVTLVNWLDGFGRLRVEECLRRGDGTRIAVSWASLLDGSFAFDPDPDFVPANLPLNVEPSRKPGMPEQIWGAGGIACPRAGSLVRRSRSRGSASIDGSPSSVPASALTSPS